MLPISSFDGEHFFLSNFFPAKVVYDGVSYISVEHAFQAAKTIHSGESPAEAVRTIWARY